jgi:hypothetical protein
VCRDLEACGYWVWPVEIDTSPPLRSRGRSRIFWLAYAHGKGESRRSFDGEMACLQAVPRYSWTDYAAPLGMDDGLPGRMDRLHQLGNAVTPYAAEIIGRAIMNSVPQKGVESKQPDKYAAHHLACITRVTGGLEGPCDCGVESSPQKGVESKQPDKYAAHYLACILRVTGGLEGPCDCGVGSSPRRGADHE